MYNKGMKASGGPGISGEPVYELKSHEHVKINPQIIYFYWFAMYSAITEKISKLRHEQPQKIVWVMRILRSFWPQTRTWIILIKHQITLNSLRKHDRNACQSCSLCTQSVQSSSIFLSKSAVIFNFEKDKSVEADLKRFVFFGHRKILAQQIHILSIKGMFDVLSFLHRSPYRTRSLCTSYRFCHQAGWSTFPKSSSRWLHSQLNKYNFIVFSRNWIFPIALYFFYQPISYEGQNKNPEMCRVLLTHEVMCRWVTLTHTHTHTDCLKPFPAGTKSKYPLLLFTLFSLSQLEMGFQDDTWGSTFFFFFTFLLLNYNSSQAVIVLVTVVTPCCFLLYSSMLLDQLLFHAGPSWFLAWGFTARPPQTAPHLQGNIFPHWNITPTLLHTSYPEM